MNDIIKQQVKKHLSFATGEDIEAICKPLKEHFGVKSLVYKWVKSDGSETILSTHPDWVDYFFEQGLYKGSALEKEPSNYVKGELLWSYIPTHTEILKATNEGFDIDNGITLIRPQQNGCEFYYFGASRDDYRAGQLLSNNVDLLDKFTHYFKYKLDAIIEKASAHPIRIPNKFEQNELSVSHIPCYQNHAMRSSFLNEIYKDGIFLSYDGESIHLTKREYLIAQEFLKGKTMQQIAADLFISPRTVETHLDHMKSKFRVRKKSELLIILSKLL